MTTFSNLSLSDMSNDELADDICTWAGRIAAGTARLLAMVAEFDRREGWAGPGMLSCAHWLSWRIGLAPGTAREWVRVARRLEELPAIREAFEAGRMTWSQARAITRVATLDDGIDWVDLAAHSSAGQLERLARGVRRAQRIEEVAADPEEAAYQRGSARRARPATSHRDSCRRCGRCRRVGRRTGNRRTDPAGGRSCGNAARTRFRLRLRLRGRFRRGRSRRNGR